MEGGEGTPFLWKSWGHVEFYSFSVVVSGKWSDVPICVSIDAECSVDFIHPCKAYFTANFPTYYLLYSRSTIRDHIILQVWYSSLDL